MFVLDFLISGIMSSMAMGHPSESLPTWKFDEKETKVTAMYGNQSPKVNPLCLFIYLFLYLNSLLFICKKSKLSVFFLKGIIYLLI